MTMTTTTVQTTVTAGKFPFIFKYEVKKISIPQFFLHVKLTISSLQLSNECDILFLAAPVEYIPHNPIDPSFCQLFSSSSQLLL